MCPTPREKQRENTLEEIKNLARHQMAERGAQALSLNGIAREIGLTAPALYRYFAGRDDLITALIIDAFESLANALDQAAQKNHSESYAARMMAIVLAYRDWAVAHPVDFALIYGTPITDYHAPEAQTTPSAQRGFNIILSVLLEAYRAGALKPFPLPENLHLQLPGVELGAQTLPEEVLYIGLVGWTRIHGILMLELFHHIQPMLPEPAVFYRVEMKYLLRSVGLEV